MQIYQPKLNEKLRATRIGSLSECNEWNEFKSGFDCETWANEARLRTWTAENSPDWSFNIFSDDQEEQNQFVNWIFRKKSRFKISSSAHPRENLISSFAEQTCWLMQILRIHWRSVVRPFSFYLLRPDKKLVDILCKCRKIQFFFFSGKMRWRLCVLASKR